MGPECRHIKTSCRKCGSPALREKPYNYYHLRLSEQRAADLLRRTAQKEELKQKCDGEGVQDSDENPFEPEN